MMMIVVRFNTIAATKEPRMQVVELIFRRFLDLSQVNVFRKMFRVIWEERRRMFIVTTKVNSKSNFVDVVREMCVNVDRGENYREEYHEEGNILFIYFWRLIF